MDQIGTIDTSILGMQQCSTMMHDITLQGIPQPSYDSHLDILQHTKVQKCRAHRHTQHNFFLSYRVFSEGTKCSYSQAESDEGLVSMIYKKLALQKRRDGSDMFVFLDKHCLKYGQNWQDGFLNGLKFSQVIVLLISNKTLQGIYHNAPSKQDNVLIEYECALIRNWNEGTPVIPIFAADITDSNNKTGPTFQKVDTRIDFPDVLHKRKPNAQQILDKIGVIPEDKRHILNSIKSTMQAVSNATVLLTISQFLTRKHIFEMQGPSLHQRGENEASLNHVVDLLLEAHTQYLDETSSSQHPHSPSSASTTILSVTSVPPTPSNPLVPPTSQASTSAPPTSFASSLATVPTPLSERSASAPAVFNTHLQTIIACVATGFIVYIVEQMRRRY